MLFALAGLYWASTLTGGGRSKGQQTVPDYAAARPLFWNGVYARGGETLYCGKRFSASHGQSINIEHVLPMAWVMNALDCETREACRRGRKAFNTIEADLHNLYPALREVNKTRGSFTFGEIRGERREFPRCDFEIDYRRRLVEPRDAARGDIARAVFYMHETYDLEVFTRLGVTLKRWNRQDPPSPEEKRRNDRIEKIQGNRNRFVDDPAAAEKLWF